MNKTITVHEAVMQNMKEMKEQFSAKKIDLQLPPPSNVTLQTKYIEIENGKSITAEIPFNHQFSNPIGVFQGGFLCAVFDEVYGPLTYMISGRPVATIEMSTTFIRPFTSKEEFVIVKAELVSKTKSLLVLKAEATNREGKLLATSTTHSMILNDIN